MHEYISISCLVFFFSKRKICYTQKCDYKIVAKEKRIFHQHKVEHKVIPLLNHTLPSLTHLLLYGVPLLSLPHLLPMECPPSLTNHYSPHSLTHSLTSHYSPQILAHSLTPFSSRSQACHHFSVCLGIRAAYSFLSFTKTKKRPLPQLCSLKPEQRNSRFSPKPSLETTTVVVRSHSERYHSLPWNLPEYARKPLFQKKVHYAVWYSLRNLRKGRQREWVFEENAFWNLYIFQHHFFLHLWVPWENTILWHYQRNQIHN